MELGRSITNTDFSKVEKHFRRLRSGNRYEDELREIENMPEREKKEEEKFMDDLLQDFKGDVRYIYGSPRSIVVDGTKRRKQ